jgi:hypothetical protein
MKNPLLRVVDLMKEGSFRSATKLVRSLDYDKRTHTWEWLIRDALEKKLDPAYVETGNIYISKYEEAGSQIDVFDVIARIPHFSYGYQVANRYLIDFLLRAGEDPVLIDMGLGKGGQAVSVMRALKERKPSLQRFTVVGLEPFADSLRAAEEAVLAAGRTLGVQASFHGIGKCAEDLSRAEWSLFDRYRGRCAINASFSLHHIVSEPHEGDERGRVLRSLRWYEPLGVVMLEGDASSLNDDDFFRRFDACWSFYGGLFRMVDALDTIAPQEKVALKVSFLGREIEDNISEDEIANRHERMEPISVWRDRLLDAGFFVRQNLTDLPAPTHPTIQVEPHKGYVSVGFDHQPILGILVAQLEKYD